MSVGHLSGARVGSLRHRFVLIVLLGAIVPLALAGLWLSNASVRSAEGILRAQRQQQLEAIERGTIRRWEHRHGELLLVSGNDVVTRTLAPSRVGTSPAITAADSTFMRSLFTMLRESIASIRLTNATGQTIWELNDANTLRTPDTIRAPGMVLRNLVTASATTVMPSMAQLPVRLPVVTDDQRVIGELTVSLYVSAMLPTDSLPIPPNGTILTITDRRSGTTSRRAGVDGDTVAADSGDWMSVRRSLNSPPFDFVLSSPTSEFVGPFRRTARFGLLVLVGVTVLTLVLSAYFTTRTTRSLRQLAEAAQAVAAGDLQRQVDAHGSDEVAQVARSFNSMTESLRGTLSELSQRNALIAVGEFAASLSHEVRNGLQSVRVDLERVRETMPPDDTAGALLERVTKGVRRLDSTVTGALAVERSGQATMQEVDLVAVLRDAIAGARNANAFDSAIEFTASAAACSMRGESEALERLFLNLLLNAVQASSDGSRVTVDLATQADTVTVRIGNRGPMLGDEALRRMEQPFYSSKPGGTGLGLTIARKIAEAHGGSLQVSSSAEVGTVVEVLLRRGLVA